MATDVYPHAPTCYYYYYYCYYYYYDCLYHTWPLLYTQHAPTCYCSLAILCHIVLFSCHPMPYCMHARVHTCQPPASLPAHSLPPTHPSILSPSPCTPFPLFSLPLALSVCTGRRRRAFRERCRHGFSKVLSIVPLQRKCTRAPTFENTCYALRARILKS